MSYEVIRTTIVTCTEPIHVRLRKGPNSGHTDAKEHVPGKFLRNFSNQVGTVLVVYVANANPLSATSPAVQASHPAMTSTKTNRT